jgi:hypothetical protein
VTAGLLLAATGLGFTVGAIVLTRLPELDRRDRARAEPLLPAPNRGSTVPVGRRQLISGIRWRVRRRAGQVGRISSSRKPGLVTATETTAPSVLRLGAATRREWRTHPGGVTSGSAGPS